LKITKGGEKLNYFEYDDFFKNVDKFHNHLMQRIFRDMENFEKNIKNDKLKGNWEIKPIETPGMKGYIARGHFQFGVNPTLTPKSALNEEREPLTDVFDEKDCVKIYLEMPGVDKKDIQLDVSEGFIEVKAKNFYKKVQLSTINLNAEKATADYKNGLLKVNIPKVQTPEEDKKRTIKID